MGKTLSIVNQKGGVGKTTTTFHIATILSNELKVLMIDLDPQGGLTYMSTGKDPDEYETTIADALVGTANIKDIIQPIRDNLYLAPANIFLSKAEIILIDKIQRELKLKKLIKTVKEDYDLIVIDTAPSLGLLTLNALLASDGIIIPVEARVMGLRGLAILQEVLKELQINIEEFNLEILGILPTFYESRTTLSKDVIETLKESFNVKIFEPIRHTIKLAETPIYRKPLNEREDVKSSDIAKSYINLAQEVKKWLKSY